MPEMDVHRAFCGRIRYASRVENSRPLMLTAKGTDSISIEKKKPLAEVQMTTSRQRPFKFLKDIV